MTFRINLKPFSLNECELYAQSRHLKMSRLEILETYMVLGGIPYYWSLLEQSKSASQNIDNLLFSHNGKLHYEYNEMYDSLFKNPEPYLNVVSTLGIKRMGMTREELINEGNITNNGLLTKVLQDLEACGFIRKYSYKGIKRSNAIFQLIDNYTLFYYKFLHDKAEIDEKFWSENINTPVRNTWEGLAFERVCFEHIRQIKQALGIAGVSTQVFPWRTLNDSVYGSGAQVDMVIDRSDMVINICEIKFSTEEYAIDSDNDADLRHKAGRFSESMKTHKSIHKTMITPFGVKANMYQYCVQSVITLDNLFEK